MKGVILFNRDSSNASQRELKINPHFDMDILDLFFTSEVGSRVQSYLKYFLESNNAGGNATSLTKMGNLVFISFLYDGYIRHDFCQEAEDGIHFVCTIDEMVNIFKAWEKLVSHEFSEITIIKKDGKIVIEGKV